MPPTDYTSKSCASSDTSADCCNAEARTDTTSPSTPPAIPDIEDLHQNAVLSKETTYNDPATGFMVFTEYAHLKRGKCCGNACRHCPYGWEGVKYRDAKGKIVRRVPRVRSGNAAGVKLQMEKIENGTYFEKRVVDDDSDSDSDSESDSDSDSDSSRSDSEIDTSSSDIENGTPNSASINFLMDPKEKQEKHETKKICNNATSKKSGGRHGGKHTEKNVPYTRTGDAGTSVLLTGERRSKDDIAFEAMGTVDELCSIVGTVHSELTCEPRDGITQHYGELEIWLLDIMSRLFDIGSHVAKPIKSVIVSEDDEDKEEGEQFQADGIGNGFDIEHTHILEDLIDIMTDKLPELTSFILPTGSKAAAQLHVARCVCRRAERRVLPLVKDGVCDPNAVKYLNRLSDFFFTAARYVNFCDGQSEFQYRRHTRGARQRNRVAIDLREEKKSE